MGSGCVGRGVGGVYEVWVGLGMRVGGEVGRARRSFASAVCSKMHALSVR